MTDLFLCVAAFGAFGLLLHLVGTVVDWFMREVIR